MALKLLLIALAVLISGCSSLKVEKTKDGKNQLSYSVNEIESVTIKGKMIVYKRSF